MPAPRREIVITFKPECAAAFGVALSQWTQAEPFVCGVDTFGNRVTAFLHAVWVTDGPKAGTWHDDRPRAVEVLHACIPDTLVECVTVEGRPW